jgi:dUTP pyrophosphatase
MSHVRTLVRSLDVQSIKFQLVHPNAKLPEKGSLQAAGYDVFACEPTVVPARGKALVATGVKYELPTDIGLFVGQSSGKVAEVRTYIRVAPRSGLALKSSIDVGAGVCDSDYTNTVGVVLFNHSDVDLVINVGDRIAQLIIELILSLPIVQVSEVTATARGEGGFGSTGVSVDELAQSKKQKLDNTQVE